MNIRTFLLYFSLACLIIVLLGALVWPFLHVDTYLQELLLDQVQSAFHGNVDVKRVTLGFFALNLHSLEIEDEQMTYRLDADLIRVEISPVEFISSRFDPLSSISSITITNPKVFIRLPDQKKPQTGAEKADSSYWSIIRGMPPYIWVDHIEIESGEVHLLTNTGKPLWSIYHIDGGLQSEAQGMVKGYLQIGNSDELIERRDIRFLLNQDEEIFTADLAMRFSEIALGAEAGLPDSFEFLTNNLAIDMHL